MLSAYEIYKFSEDNTFSTLTITTRNALKGTWETVPCGNIDRLKNHIKAIGCEFEITECYSLDDVSGKNYFYRTNNPQYAICCSGYQDYFDILILSSIEEFNDAYSNVDTPSYKTRDLECQYRYSNARCGALCTDHNTFCNQHYNEIMDTLEYLDNKLKNSSKTSDYEVDILYMEVKY